MNTYILKMPFTLSETYKVTGSKPENGIRSFFKKNFINHTIISITYLSQNKWKVVYRERNNPIGYISECLEITSLLLD